MESTVGKLVNSRREKEGGEEVETKYQGITNYPEDVTYGVVSRTLTILEGQDSEASRRN